MPSLLYVHGVAVGHGGQSGHCFLAGQAAVYGVLNVVLPIEDELTLLVQVVLSAQRP